MAKQKGNTKDFACNNCKFFTNKCEHQSNLLISLNMRVETIKYKSLDKKTECEFCTVKD